MALISAGESDMETDRISSLHTSCLGFAPLIFDLKESEEQRVNFDQLMNACDPVWKAVETDQMLPRKLVKQPNYRMKPFNCFPTEHLVCLYLLNSLQNMFHLFWNTFTYFSLIKLSFWLYAYSQSYCSVFLS